MKKGKCPKCQSSEVYSGANIRMKKGAYGVNTIPLGGILGSHIALDNYVCTNCGYLESFISNPKDLETIRRKWERAY